MPNDIYEPAPEFAANAHAAKATYDKMYADSIEDPNLEADPWEMRDLGPDHAAHPGLLAELVRCSAAYGLDLSQAV